MFEWFNPLYLKDKANNFTTDDYVQVPVTTAKILMNVLNLNKLTNYLGID